MLRISKLLFEVIVISNIVVWLNYLTIRDEKSYNYLVSDKILRFFLVLFVITYRKEKKGKK